MCRVRKVDIIGVSLLTSAVISKDKSIYFKFTPRNLCLDSFCFFAIQSGIDRITHRKSTTNIGM